MTLDDGHQDVTRSFRLHADGLEEAEGRQDRGSEADNDEMNVADEGPAIFYRSHEPTRANTGRWRSVLGEAERFWSKVDRTDPSGCWIWLGQVNQWGYGHFRRTLAPGQHRTVKAHRFAYELEVGPITDGLTLDHLCGHRGCVRPDHLEPVTNAENLRRRHARHRILSNDIDEAQGDDVDEAQGDNITIALGGSDVVGAASAERAFRDGFGAGWDLCIAVMQHAADGTGR